METVAIVFLAAVVGLLLLPVRLRVAGTLAEDGSLSLAAGGALFAGLVGVVYSRAESASDLGLTIGSWRVVTLKSFGKVDGSEEEADEKAGKKKPAPRPKEVPQESLWSRIRHMGDLAERMRLPVWRFVKRLVGAFSIRKLRTDVNFGSASPDVTGRAMGYVAAVRPLLGRKVDLNLKPDFGQKQLNGEADLEIALWPVQAVWAIACFSPYGVMLWISEMRRSRKQRKAA